MNRLTFQVKTCTDLNSLTCLVKTCTDLNSLTCLVKTCTYLNSLPCLLLLLPVRRIFYIECWLSAHVPSVQLKANRIYTVKNGMNVFTSGIALVGWWTLTLPGTGQWCWLDVELVVWCSRWWWYAGRKNIDIHQQLYTVFCRLHYLWFCCLMVWECVPHGHQLSC
jgi:hypothetical protein